MRALASSGLKLALTFLLMSRMAPACGHPSAYAKPSSKAQFIIQSSDGSIRKGEAVYANLILPENSRLSTGTLQRASCTSFQFKVKPETGWHDPWAEWYESGIPQHATGRDGPFTCGVVSTMIGHPVPPPQINFTLNDWIEFDRPGKYKIAVKYRTEFRDYEDLLEDPYDDRNSTSWVTLSSDPIEVEVLPEAANAASRAEDALAELRRYYGADDPVCGESRPFDVPEWAQYSQTDAVVPLLTEFYEAGSYIAKRGLIASPHQELVVREMEKALVSPRHSVSFDFVDVLAFNAARLQHPELFRGNENMWSAKWEPMAQKRNEAYLSALAEYVRKLLLAMPEKRGYAQTDSLDAALLVLSRWNVPDKGGLRKLATQDVARLGPRMKEPLRMWDEEWRVVASPALLPYLRMHLNYGHEMRWLYELAPEEAWQRMLAAAARGNWGMAWSWASVMPEVERHSIALDRYLLKALRKGTDHDEAPDDLDHILLRFGGPELVRPVRQLVDSYICMGQPSLWAFLLRHEGQAAEDRLIRLYGEQVSHDSHQADAALQQTLGSFRNRYWSPRLEAIVQSQLDKDDAIASGAARLLQRFGSEDDQKALWARLDKWHRQAPLRLSPEKISLLQEDDLETALITALLNGNHWVTDRSMIKQLHALCVYQCESLKFARSVDQVQPLTVSMDPLSPTFSGRYRSEQVRELEDSLSHFPAGTRFAITVFPGTAPTSGADVDARFPELGRFMHEHQYIVLDRLPYDAYGRCREKPDPAYTATASN